MARTIAQIQQSIIDAKNTDSTLAGLTSASQVAIWLLWTWVVATCQWTLENLFDIHKAEVDAILSTQRPHTLQWYVTKAKAFQLGDTLLAKSDVYYPVVAANLIVANAAAIELVGMIRIKAAKLVSSVLAPLSGPELTAFSAYMGRVKGAGVRIQCTSGLPDDFRLALGIFYDPLILDNTGARLDGTAAAPVNDAVNAFLNNLPFNGIFVLNYLVATLQGIEGVRIGEVLYCAARYGSLPYTAITYEYIPDAGYMQLDAAYFITNTTYTAHGPI
jgi:hypothetical protein